MKTLLTIWVLSLAVVAAQDVVLFDRYPHPYLLPSANLNGAGFQGVSAAMSGGFMFEAPRFSLEFHGTYNAARKVNDGTGDNPHGHVRSVNGSAFIRLPRYWLAGVNYGYGALSTTNYKKSGSGYSVGGGRDFILSDASFRMTALYGPPSGGAQGLDVTFTLPSPITQHHFYFYEDLGVTILSAGPIEAGGHTATLRSGIIFRF